MSHIVNIKTKIRDPAALTAACQRLGLAAPVHGTATLFAGQQVTGLIVQLPGWHYPAVVDAASGQVKFDNYGGKWGAQTELDKLLQAYACEKAKLEARRAGHTVTEQTLSNGAIKLTIQVAGAIGGAA
jgi:hypothetical protein